MHSARIVSVQAAPSACLMRQARSSARPNHAFAVQPLPSRRQHHFLTSLEISSGAHWSDPLPRPHGASSHTPVNIPSLPPAVVAKSSSAEVATEGSFIAVLKPEDLPKGGSVAWRAAPAQRTPRRSEC
jgi:hypothetical protein